MLLGHMEIPNGSTYDGTFNKVNLNSINQINQLSFWVHQSPLKLYFFFKVY